MPYIKGVATSYRDMLDQLIAWVTDDTIHGQDAWELVRDDPFPRGTILRAKGYGENDRFYIGFMPLDIVPGHTYQSWLGNSDTMGSKIIWNPRYLNMVGSTYSCGGMGGSIGSGEDAVGFSFAAEVFERPAKAMFMGCFKQYDSGLMWDELPGGMDTEKPAGIMTQHFYLYPPKGEPQDMLLEPPLMPGLGNPAFGMNVNHPLQGKLNYWFVKHRSNVTIVTNHYDGPLKDEEYWDVGHVGYLVPYGTLAQKDETPFPAVVIGPTSGAWSKGMTDCMLKGQPFPHVGTMFDFTYTNWELTRGVPTYPTANYATKYSPSQVTVCLPNSEWANVTNWVQGTRVIPIPPDYKSWRYANAQPVQPTNIDVYMRPTKSEIENTRHVYDITPQDKLNPTIDFQLEPLQIVQNIPQLGNVPSTGNMLGYVKGIYWPSVEPKEFGEVTINGKQCLMLPNCWEHRRWFIPDQDTQITDHITLKAQHDDISRKSRAMNCLIKLED